MPLHGAWLGDYRRSKRKALTSAVLVVLGTAMLVLILLAAQFKENTESLQEAMQTQLYETSARLRVALDEYETVIELMAIDIEENPDDPVEHYRFEAATAYEVMPGFQAINWVGPDGTIEIVYPPEGNAGALGANLNQVVPAAAAFQNALATGETHASEVLTLLQGGRGFALYRPVTWNGELVGVVNAVFKVEEFFGRFLGDQIGERYILRVLDDEQLVLETSDSSAVDKLDGIVARQEVGFAYQSWTLVLLPRDELINAYRSQFAGGILLTGVIVLILGVLTYVLILRHQRVKLSEKRFRDLSGLLPDMVIEADRDFVVTYMNKLAMDTLGYDSASLREGIDLLHILVRDDEIPLVRRQYEAIGPGRSMKQVRKILMRDGGLSSCDVTVGAIHDTNGGFSGVRCVVRDISDILDAERKLRRLATTNEVTNLPNRKLFLDILSFEFRKARNHNAGIWLVALDVDHFKEINEAKGHAIGDQFLRETGERLDRLCDKVGFVASMGADEFAVLITEQMDDERFNEFIGQVNAELNQPVPIDQDEPLKLGVSIGYAHYPEDADSAEQLFTHATAALYSAKAQGGGVQQGFTAEISSKLIKRKTREEELKQALVRDEFVLFYQPLVDARGGELVGAEALIRWQHPTEGLVGPFEFIPLAEELGLIDDIGAWAVRAATAQLADWNSIGHKLHVSVNVSAKQLDQGRLGMDVASALAEYKVHPSDLWLEITESLLMKDVDKATRTLDWLKQQGISIAIDDFGTGYSSLAYLNRLPIDVLKIDRSFVAPSGTSAGDTRVTESIIDLARNLSMDTVAEGVETVQQRNYLISRGCNVQQGYLFSRPIPAMDFELILQRGLEEIIEQD